MTSVFTRFIVGAGLFSLLSACAWNSVGPAGPVLALKEDFWSQTDRSVAVALAKLPDTAAHKSGVQMSLLDLAVNEVMASELNAALRKITLTDSYGQARGEIVKRMQEKGMKAFLFKETIDADALQDFGANDESRAYAKKDFRALKAEIGADRLLLVTVVAVGTQRAYHRFLPQGRPAAMLTARGEIIDLQTNELLWREQTSNVQAIDDPWDQPPDFQNVHVAVQKVILSARNSMIALLFDGW